MSRRLTTGSWHDGTNPPLDGCSYWAIFLTGAGHGVSGEGWLSARDSPPFFQMGSCMNLSKILILLPLAFVGCNKPETVYLDRPVEVKVMVPIPCPQPPVIKRPVLKPLPPSATPQQVMEAALRSMAEVMGYAEQLEVLLDAYREKK